MINSQCGIAAMGFYLPEKEIPLLDLAETAGIPAFVAEFAGARTVRAAAADELPSEMAINAAEAALQDGDIDPEEIDLIIYCGAGVPDYILPPSAGRVQDAVGANRAMGFDLSQGCCGMQTAMQVAKAQIALNEGCNMVMLVTGDKWSRFTHHHTADSVFFGDGGGAIIMKKGHPDLQPVASEIVTKGNYYDLWCIEAGGLRHPASSETLQKNMHTYKCIDPERARHEFKEIYIPVMAETVMESLKKAGISRDQVAFFSMVNANLKVQELLLNQLEIPLERSSADYLERFGHFGSQDTFFNLDLAVKDGKISKGDYIVMLTTGIGFSWGSAVIKY
ncbi:MAG: 3-oxoacyl-[acyl-carrier-protein] synthase III C-terminal domain-containing protein [Pseudomonadota bacterium]|nr:3-oxoacyl-[acyl-carrier-protein] synthase III C-terminal domain-containing protein [Pseudomonadota bacterium]